MFKNRLKVLVVSTLFLPAAVWADVKVLTTQNVTHVTPAWEVTEVVADVAYGKLTLKNNRPVWISVNLYGLGSHGYITNGRLQGDVVAPNAAQLMPPWCKGWSPLEYFVPPRGELYFDFAIPIRAAPYELWFYKDSEPVRYVGCLDTFVYWKFGSHIPAGALTAAMFALKEYGGLAGGIAVATGHMVQGEYGEVFKDIVNIFKEPGGAEMFAELARVSGHPVSEKALRDWAFGLGEVFKIPEAVDVLLTLYFTADDEKYEFKVENVPARGGGGGGAGGGGGRGGGGKRRLPRVGGDALIVSNRAGWQDYLSAVGIRGTKYSGSTFPADMNAYDFVVLDNYGGDIYDADAGKAIRNYVSGGGRVLITSVVPGKLAAGNDLTPIEDWLGAGYLHESKGVKLSLATTADDAFGSGYPSATTLYAVPGNYELGTVGLADVAARELAEWSSYGAGVVAGDYGRGKVVYATVGLPGDYGSYGKSTDAYYYVLAYAFAWMAK